MNKKYTSEEFRSLPLDERRAVLDALRAELRSKQQATATPTPEPEPHVEPAASYKLPTNRMRQQLARFDDLTDGDQVDHLATLWGKE